MFELKIFQFDDPENTQGLHVQIARIADIGPRCVKEVRQEDLPLYQKILDREMFEKCGFEAARVENSFPPLGLS